MVLGLLFAVFLCLYVGEFYDQSGVEVHPCICEYAYKCQRREQFMV